MSYEIIKTDGTPLVIVEDGLLDQTSASIAFVGKNVVNYGAIQNNNLLHMLENFAYEFEPAVKFTGQLWMDTGTGSLKFYNQTDWQQLSTLSYSPVSTNAPSRGNLWYDSMNKQLFINNGSGFDLIGPDKATGFDTTRLVSDVLIDNATGNHAVIKMILDNEILAIISKDTFTLDSGNPIDGFSSIRRGITFKNSASSDVELQGFVQNAVNAGTLNNLLLTSVANNNTVMQRDYRGYTAVKKLTASELASNNGVLSGPWKVSSELIPSDNSNIVLGNTDLRWKNIYSHDIDSETAHVNILLASQVQFQTIVDSGGHEVTDFDLDGALSANSDNYISTQKAVKTYVDTAISSEAQTRANAITNLQNQINALSFIPAGTVMYTTSENVPSGFLAANGQIVSKDSFYPLYVALGGDSTPYGQSGANFTVPDLRGQFIRSWDHGRGLDNGRAIGTVQSDGFKSHNHGMPGDDQLVFADGYSGWTASYRGAFPYDANSSYGGGAKIWNTTDEGMSETRPTNVALHAIIKY